MIHIRTIFMISGGGSQKGRGENKEEEREVRDKKERTFFQFPPPKPPRALELIIKKILGAQGKEDKWERSGRLPESRKGTER